MAWECAVCSYYLEINNPPPECPECGAPQEQLFWVDDEVDDDDDDLDDEDAVLFAEEEDEDGEEEYIPELGDEFGGALGAPRDAAYRRAEDEDEDED